MVKKRETKGTNRSWPKDTFYYGTSNHTFLRDGVFVYLSEYQQ